MASDAPIPPSHHDVPQGLPPVKPPSARFIVQLFLIPGLIVAGLVFVFLFSLAWVGTSTPESFLSKLDSTNPDIRWRAAHDLAQVLQRPESLELASNPDFAMDIAERLRKAHAELEVAENAAKAELFITIKGIEATSLSREEKAKQEDQAAVAAWRKLRPQRDLVLFLTSCLGNFTVPVGVPVLSDIAMKETGAEVKGLALRRQRAVLALANLGDNIKRRYHGEKPNDETKPLSSLQKTAVLEKLDKAAAGSGERAKMARYARDVLMKKQPAGVDIVLARCARAEDIFLRELVGHALNFWDGDEVEPTLLLLANDKGQGKRIEVSEAD
jgi:hypothetical protein